jgi:nucleotide-binding universal stress UspA family protein
VLSQDGTFAGKLRKENAMYQNILLAYDGSTESQQALLNCKDLSQWKHAKVHLLSVMPYGAMTMGHESAYVSEKESNFEENRRLVILNEGVKQLKATGVEATGELIKGDAVDQIVECAQSIGADLIMLGHRHRDNWLARWWGGSVPKALIEHSPCSVLVVIIK